MSAAVSPHTDSLYVHTVVNIFWYAVPSQYTLISPSTTQVNTSKSDFNVWGWFHLYKGHTRSGLNTIIMNNVSRFITLRQHVVRPAATTMWRYTLKTQSSFLKKCRHVPRVYRWTSYSRMQRRFWRGSQWHFVAFNADFHSMRRSAFFPDVCELSHLFVQAADPFLRASLELERKQRLAVKKWIPSFSKLDKPCMLNSSSICYTSLQELIKHRRIWTVYFQMKGKMCLDVAQMQILP